MMPTTTDTGRLSWLRLALTLATIGLVALGCALDSSPENTTTAGVVEGSVLAPDVVNPSQTRSADAARDALRDDFAGAWQQYAAHVIGTPIRYLLLGEADSVILRRTAFLAALYAARDWQPIFAGAAAAAGRADAVLATLRRAPEHALNPDTYLRAPLVEAETALAELNAVWNARPDVTPSDDELDHLLDVLALPEVRAADDVLFAAFDYALTNASTPTPELAAAHTERILIEQAVAGQAALFEVLMADAFLAWAFDQRHFNLAGMSDDLSESERNELIAERMRGSFGSMAATADRAAADAYMQTLQPHHPQYPLLMTERARYAAIVANGGWQTITPMSLRRGHNHARVAELKRRLQIEGYYSGEINNSFDDELKTAVELYQETHQMETTGESSQSFWSSLNISAEDRLAQIELTMQRWREARAGDDPYYIHVNIPDFHAEVWRNGVREMRFRIVVGNTQRVCDPSTGTWRYANATPVQSAIMSYVVLNPSWNIPPRILEEELLPNLLEDETYFAENGIERVVENGVARVRQIPGPTNPLGRVKFMFPNPHDTYMHDTSRPQYFRYPVRAFSHGCMRVQDPVSFLEQILRNDGQLEQRDIDRIFESNIETSIRLQTAIPVHIEYFVVRVDDNGRANFNADIYRYDRDRLNPPPPSELRCTPPGQEPLRLVLGEDARPRFRDRVTGEEFDPNAPQVQGVVGEEVPVDAADPAAGDFGP